MKIRDFHTIEFTSAEADMGVKMLEDKEILLPPWLACPEIERYSIGWRMGYGEDYIMKCHEWYESLLPEEAASYRDLFPEPPTWKG